MPVWRSLMEQGLKHGAHRQMLVAISTAFRSRLSLQLEVIALPFSSQSSVPSATLAAEARP